MSDYIYLGDRFTDPKYKGAKCSAVRRKSDNKCIRSRMGTMLVEFELFGHVNVIGRLLRKIKP